MIRHMNSWKTLVPRAGTFSPPLRANVASQLLNLFQEVSCPDSEWQAENRTPNRRWFIPSESVN